MKNVLTLIACTFLSLPVWAGSSLSTVTVSQTLTMTSPSAIISASGISATASITTVYAKNISTTNLNIGTSATFAAWPLNDRLPKLIATMNGSGGCTIVDNLFNAASCQRLTTGSYGVSFTTPVSTNLYQANCSANGASVADGYWATSSGTISNTTAGFYFKTILINGGALTFADTNRITCVVYAR